MATPYQPAFPPDHYLNRELSWLEFNARVLHEAEDPRVSLLERVKFLAIFSSNLDEFFMVRVAGLLDQVVARVAVLSPDGRTPQQVLAEVNSAVKAVRKNLQVGFHIEHVNSFNPIFRATRRYDELANKADFLKIVVYNNCGGERYARFIENVGATVFRDVPKDELLRFNDYLLNYANEASLGDLPGAGLSPDYIARETRRALEGVRGKCKILPGIDIGIPTGKNSRKASPADTYAATAAALKAGADGVIFSRKYSEMRLENLAAAGRAVREFKA